MPKLLESDISTREVLEWKGLHLFNFIFSSCSQKLRIVLNLKGIPWESHPINLRENENYTEWFLGINPRGLLPVLVHDGAVYIESNDILEYLERTFPNPPLIPDGMAAQVHEELLMEDDLHMDIRTLTFRFIFGASGGPAKDPEALRKYEVAGGTIDGQEDNQKLKEISFFKKANSDGIGDEQVRIASGRLHERLTKLNSRLEQQPYLMGDMLTAVDIVWFIYCTRIEMAGYPVSRLHPYLGGWHAGLMLNPKFSNEVAPPPPLIEMVNKYHSELKSAGTRLVDIAGL